jgi:hypothetical protein
MYSTASTICQWTTGATQGREIYNCLVVTKLLVGSPRDSSLYWQTPSPAVLPSICRLDSLKSQIGESW